MRLRDVIQLVSSIEIPLPGLPEQGWSHQEEGDGGAGGPLDGVA
jgi:hypothetical protein